MRRRLRSLGLASAVAVAALAAAPVPSPVHVQPGVAAAAGTVSWVPAVQQVTGEVGEAVAVDLALDDGTEHDVQAELVVREVEIDAATGPEIGGSSSALTLAVDRITLRPGDRGAFRAVAHIPPEATLVAVEARLERDDDATPVAFVLLGPAGRHPEVSADIALAGGDAAVTVTNSSPFPALVDVAVSSATWVGPTDDVQIGDVLVPAGGERSLDVELSRGLGRRTAAVAVAPRGAPPDRTARASTAAWPPRTIWAVVAALLIGLVGGAALRVLRRS